MGIRHAPPAGAGYRAVYQLAAWTVLDQQSVNLSTDNAAMLFHDV
jgi:hypothetical protein